MTPDYYGYRDDDDGVLAAKEADQEVRGGWFTCVLQASQLIAVVL